MRRVDVPNKFDVIRKYQRDYVIWHIVKKETVTTAHIYEYFDGSIEYVTHRSDMTFSEAAKVLRYVCNKMNHAVSIRISAKNEFLINVAGAAGFKRKKTISGNRTTWVLMKYKQ